MKKFLTALFLLIPVIGFAQAENVTLTRVRKTMNVEMDLNIDKSLVRSAKTYVLRPVLMGAEDTLALKPVGYYSREKFYPLLTEAGVDGQLQKADLPATLHYSDAVAYEKWMNGATLVLRNEYIGCCGDSGSFDSDPIGEFDNPVFDFVPQFIYVDMGAYATKIRKDSVVTTIHFPVKSTKLNPNHLHNAIALHKIKEAIEKVDENPDYTIQNIYLSSTASPEGSYKLNESLAKGRVEAIADYLAGKVDLPTEHLITSYTAEDMDGLREYIAESELDDKDALLAIMDSAADNDAKERQLAAHAASWKKIMKDCIPMLRKTRCAVEYGIRTYVTPQEILKVIKHHPEDVSLKEYHIAASSLPAGSPEFIEVYRKALEQFPDDEAANLNAANADMVEEDYVAAEAKLAKAGNSPEAEYSRGMLLCAKGQYQEALPHLRTAAAAGIEHAAIVIDEIEVM